MIRSARMSLPVAGKPETIKDVVDDIDATKNMVFALHVMGESPHFGGYEGGAFMQVAISAVRALDEISERLMTIYGREREAGR